MKISVKSNTLNGVALALSIFVAAACLPKTKKPTLEPAPKPPPSLNLTTPPVTSTQPQTFSAFAADTVEVKVTHNGEYPSDEEYTKALKERGGGVLFAPVNEIALWKLEFKEASNSHIDVVMNAEDNSGIQCTVASTNKFECKNIIENAGTGDLKFKVYSKSHCLNSLVRSVSHAAAKEKCMDLKTYPTDAFATKSVPFEALDVGVASSRKSAGVLCGVGSAIGDALVDQIPDDNGGKGIFSEVLKVINKESDCK